MPDIWLLMFFAAIPLLGWGSFRLGVRNGLTGVGTRMAAARAAGMILLLALGFQLGGIVGVISTAVVPCLFLLGWGHSRGVATAD